jgi:transcription elongation factor Elf1
MKVFNPDGRELSPEDVKLARAVGTTSGMIKVSAQCPVCDVEFVKVMKIGQKNIKKTPCPQCGNKLDISSDGDVIAYGPAGKRPSTAEDLNIKYDLNCGACVYYNHYKPRKFWIICFAIGFLLSISFYGYGMFQHWIPDYWKFVGSICAALILGATLFVSLLVYMMCDFDTVKVTCNNKEATAVTGTDIPIKINLNQRCKFWKNRRGARPELTPTLAVEDEPPSRRQIDAKIEASQSNVITPTYITFSCPECNGSLEVDATGAGRLVPCPFCQKPITIPKLTHNAPVEHIITQSEPPPIPPTQT